MLKLAASRDDKPMKNVQCHQSPGKIYEKSTKETTSYTLESQTKISLNVRNSKNTVIAVMCQLDLSKTHLAGQCLWVTARQAGNEDSPQMGVAQPLGLYCGQHKKRNKQVFPFSFF